MWDASLVLAHYFESLEPGPLPMSGPGPGSDPPEYWRDSETPDNGAFEEGASCGGPAPAQPCAHGWYSEYPTSTLSGTETGLLGQAEMAVRRVPFLFLSLL